MDQASLFAAALGLRDPWRVTGVEFNPKESQLELRIDFEAGARFPCPDCQDLCLVHDTVESTWRHLDFFQHKTLLTARHPRTKCPEHAVKKIDVPWGRPRSGFSFLFEAMVLALAPHMPVAALARQVKETDPRIWRIIQHHVNEARATLDMSTVKSVGIDETSQRKRHTYISIFMDLEERRVLYATPGRNAQTVERFREDLETHGGTASRVRTACIDMSPSYKAGVAREFPNAAITFDRFHVLKLVNDALDKVRRQERRLYRGLKRSKFLWLRNPENLTPEQATEVEALSQEFPDTALAYQLKLSLLDFWKLSPRKARKRLRTWINWARATDLRDFHRVADTFEANIDGIESWHKTRLSNGILEGINSLVQAAKAKARGYANPGTMITMTYLIAGRLPLAVPT
jgi:transposase